MAAVTITCLANNVNFVASERLLSQSPRVAREVALFGARHIYLPEKYHPSLVAKVIEWTENQHSEHTIIFSPDLGEVLELADELELDELFGIAAQCIGNTVYLEGKIAAPVQELVGSISDPVCLRLLDYAEPAAFELLRIAIPPYNHQYKRQVEKLLYHSHFARSLHLHLAEQTYQTVLKLRRSVSDQVQNGMCDLGIHTCVDKAECSHTRYLFTLERATERLTVWDLLSRPFARVGVCGGIIDAAFGPADIVFTLEFDRHIHVRRVSGRELAAIPCGHANALSAANDHLLAFSTYFLPELHSALTFGSYLWKWSSVMAAVDVQDAEISTTACISPDGEFIVHSHRGAVWLSPVDPDNVKHARVLTKPDDITYGQLGDVMALAVSEDGSTIAAVYICVVKFWWIHDRMSSQSLDIGFTFREAFGHVAFSPDGRRVVLGTWEGSVIQYVWYDGIFHFHSRSGVGKAILHLSWSKDGHFIAVSSSGGVTFIQPH